MTTLHSNRFCKQIQFVIAIIFWLSAQSLSAQTISFISVWNKEEAKPYKRFYSEKIQDSVQLETLRFYVSKVCFLKNEQHVWEEKNSFHLMDWDEEMSFKVDVAKDFDALSFCIGIDSVTNVSGAMGGDLDPTIGMYWTWQSGYINFKIEGTSPVCKTRNHAFQWHVGGYQFLNAAIQEIKLACRNKKEIVIAVDLKKMFEQASVVTHPEVMSPSKEAVQLSSVFKTCFSIKE